MISGIVAVSYLIGLRNCNFRSFYISAVKPRKIPEIVYKQLVSLITSGHFKPGEKLPSERDMALELGVSRQSIREAINRAKMEGLIGVKQGGGTFVISSFANRD